MLKRLSSSLLARHDFPKSSLEWTQISQKNFTLTDDEVKYFHEPGSVRILLRRHHKCDERLSKAENVGKGF